MKRLVLLAVLLGHGCAPQAPPDAPPPTDEPAPPTVPVPEPVVADTTPVRDTLTIGDPPTRVAGAWRRADSTRWTTGDVNVQRPAVGVATLRAVRAATHHGFDRLVFTFDGTAVPSYRVGYVDRPLRACGSGEAVPLDGDAWLQLQFTPAQAHDERGHATAGERRRRLDLPNARELALLCDFEADVTWAVGLSAPMAVRTMELSGPPRLVVDVRQP